MDACPNSYESGCRCVQHAPGLMAHAPDPAAYAAALARNQPTRLHVVTMPGPLDRPPCQGTMTCGCADCVLERGKRGPRGNGPQPWMPRASRRAA